MVITKKSKLKITTTISLKELGEWVGELANLLLKRRIVVYRG